MLRYLGRYTHRVAISNHRLIAFDGDRVTFYWKDYAHESQRRTMTLTALEFLRRFVQHVLPRGFVRIRQCGQSLSNRSTRSRPACAPAPAAASARACDRSGVVLSTVRRPHGHRSHPHRSTTREGRSRL